MSQGEISYFLPTEAGFFGKNALLDMEVKPLDTQLERLQSQQPMLK